jgi:hypothetical protein
MKIVSQASKNRRIKKRRLGTIKKLSILSLQQPAARRKLRTQLNLLMGKYTRSKTNKMSH